MKRHIWIEYFSLIFPLFESINVCKILGKTSMMFTWTLDNFEVDHCLPSSGGIIHVGCVVQHISSKIQAAADVPIVMCGGALVVLLRISCLPKASHKIEYIELSVAMMTMHLIDDNKLKKSHPRDSMAERSMDAYATSYALSF